MGWEREDLGDEGETVLVISTSSCLRFGVDVDDDVDLLSGGGIAPPPPVTPCLVVFRLVLVSGVAGVSLPAASTPGLLVSFDICVVAAVFDTTAAALVA